MKTLILGVVLVAGLAACGGDSAPAQPEPVRSGADLFAERILGPNPGCITCHSLDPETTLVGPSIAGVATRADGRVGGVSAADYLRKSITAPSAFVVPGFDDGKMPDDWDEVLTEGEIEALVSYLLTLR